MDARASERLGGRLLAGRHVRIPVGAALCVPLLAGLLPMVAIKGGGNDFGKAYYHDARTILETGTFDYTFEGAKNLPIVVAALTPFAALERETAEVVFVATNQLAYVGAFLLLARTFARSPRDVWVLATLFVASTAIWVCVRLGQTTPIAFFLVVLGLTCGASARTATASAVLALAFLAKIPLALLSMPFLRWRDWPALGGYAGAVLAAVTLSLAWFGLGLHLDYWQNVVVVNAGTTLLASNNQNLLALLTRWLHEPAFGDYTATAVPAWIQWPVTIATLTWLTLWFRRAGVSRIRRLPQAWLIDGSLLICTALLVFPVSWDHYYLLAIVPLYSAYTTMVERARRWEWGLLTLSFLAINLPEPVRASPLWQPVALQLTIVSAPTLGMLTLLGWLTWRHLPPRRTSGARDEGARP